MLYVRFHGKAVLDNHETHEGTIADEGGRIDTAQARCRDEGRPLSRCEADGLRIAGLGYRERFP
jgi:hypothetical protein